MDDILSSSQVLISGVVQEHILGLILFNTFVNDLLEVLKNSDIYKFSDDISCLCENSCRFLGTSTTEGNQRQSNPATENKSHYESQEGVANMTCKLLQQQGAPVVEMDKLRDNPLEYQYLEVVERKIKDPVGRLTRLIKLTDDEAKDLLKHCIHLAPDIGYDTVITLLNKRYGNPHLLLASYSKEIKSLAPVKPGDTMGFRKFHYFVLKCGTCSKITNWNSLETPETLCILVLKLPGGLRDRWNRTVQGIRRSYDREPCLSDFSGFVKEETILVNDPIFYKKAVQEYVTHPEEKIKKHKKIGNFATHFIKEVS